MQLTLCLNNSEDDLGLSLFISVKVVSNLEQIIALVFSDNGGETISEGNSPGKRSVFFFFGRHASDSSSVVLPSSSSSFFFLFVVFR